MAPKRITQKQEQNMNKKAKVAAEAQPPEHEEAPAPDAHRKADMSRMIGFLKYRADPGKNKKQENMIEAQKALEAP